MVTEAMRGARLVGMLQPKFAARAGDTVGEGDLTEVGCLGRITQYAETGDGRILITLMGISRFRVLTEVPNKLAFRTCRITAEPFQGDFTVGVGNDEVDRKTLLETFKAYLEARNLEADWDSIERASNESLVNTLSMMSPYGPGREAGAAGSPNPERARRHAGRRYRTGVGERGRRFWFDTPIGKRRHVARAGRNAQSTGSRAPEGPCRSKLLEMLVCPVTKSLLEYDATRQELISRAAKLAYPIRDGVPIMLPEEARALEE